MPPGSRRYSPPGSSSVVVESAPVRSMAVGLSRRYTPAARSVSHRRAAAEAHTREPVAYRLAVYRLAAPRLASYRPVALVEHTLGAGVSAAWVEWAAYMRPSPAADRLRVIVPAAARPAVYKLAEGLRAVCLKAACRPLCQRNLRAADSTRAWWDPHRRRAADSTRAALAPQRARPEAQSASRRQILARPEARSGQ